MTASPALVLGVSGVTDLLWVGSGVVLGFAGVKSIFFPVADLGCVGIGAGSRVDSPGMFSFLLCRVDTGSKPFLLLTSPYQQAGWGCTSSWEGTELGQLSTADQRDMTDIRAPCSVYKGRCLLEPVSAGDG